MRGDTPEVYRATENSSVGGPNRKRDASKHWSFRNPFSHSCSLHRLPVIGYKIRNKGGNNIRFYFENFNGIRSGIKGADKGGFFGKLMENLDVDCFGAAETNLQWKLAKNSPSKIIGLGKNTRTAYACNRNEQTTEKQQGGTIVSMMEYYSPYVEETGSDETGLGRWSWIKLKGNNNLKTMIISAYMTCKPRKQSILSDYV